MYVCQFYLTRVLTYIVFIISSNVLCKCRNIKFIYAYSILYSVHGSCFVTILVYKRTIDAL